MSKHTPSRRQLNALDDPNVEARRLELCPYICETSTATAQQHMTELADRILEIVAR